MRLWSIHPKYLDRMGLLALWREAILAKKILFGEELKPGAQKYINHPHFKRFKPTIGEGWYKQACMMVYLKDVYEEGVKRGYKFNKDLALNTSVTKIFPSRTKLGLGIHIPVTTGQLMFELELLKEKVSKRDKNWFSNNLSNPSFTFPQPNETFLIKFGEKEEWETGKLKVEKDHSNG